MGPTACFRALGVLLFLTIAIRTGFAADDSASPTDAKRYLPWDKGSVALGGFVTVFNSSISFGLDNAPGVNIDAEKTLGLDSTLSVFQAKALYRPGESLRNQVELSYASYDRAGDAILSQDLTIDGVTYPIGARVQTVFNFTLIQGSYSYAVVQNERARLAIGASAYVVPLKYGLNITTSGGRTNVNGADTALPLPALALRSEFQVIPRLYLNAGLDAMYLEIAGYRGSLLDFKAGAEYRLWKNFGLGLGYGFTGINVDAKSSRSGYPGASFVGKVDVRFSGLLLYGKLSF